MYDIIYFGNDWYAENKTSSHHIAEQLARGNRVLYIECPGLRVPKTTSRDVKKLFSKIGKSLKGTKKLSNSVHLYTLFQIPLHRYKLVRWLNKLLIISVLKILIYILKFRNPILWFMVPHLYMVPGRINSSAVVYYCIDDFAALPDVDVESVSMMDEEMTKKADIVFIASDTLFEKKRRLNSNVHISPHGVDFQLFNRVYTGSITTIPDDVKPLIGRPIIGFFGLIEEWIDLELIKYIANHNPEWQVLMIGRVAIKNNICDGLENVHFIGRKQYNLLPDYTAVFDVAMLPYRLNQQVLNCNPIKLREYLASSKPIVSVRFPQVEHYSEFVEIADDYEQFTRAIQNSLQNDNALKREARVASVRGATWEARVQNVMIILDEFMAKEKLSVKY